MSSGWIITLEFALVIGLVLGFGIWQLISLRKYRDQDRAGRDGKRD